MGFGFVKDKINNGDYIVSKYDYVTCYKVPDTHIFDEDKSVKWNNQEREKVNKEYELQIQKYNQASNECLINFENDCIQAIIDEYGFNLATSKKIYSKAYEDSHSYGYHEVVIYCERICDFVYDILNCNKR